MPHLRLAPLLPLFLLLANPALASAAQFSANKRVEVSVDGTVCSSGLFRKTTVSVTRSAIEIECKRFFKTKGYTRKLSELDNFRWESGLTRGRLVATEKGGREFYIDLRKAELPALKAALKDHMDGEKGGAKGKKGR
jgi:hypothetical protein